MFDEILNQYQNKYGKSVLELGPGETKQFEYCIGLDMVNKDSVDFVCDLSEGFSFIQDSCIDEIHTSHFLEHIDNLPLFLKEVFRVLKPGGRMVNVVPHFSNPYYYSDYTHKAFWGLYSISYFSKNSFFKRKVPMYYNDIDFDILDVKLIFRSDFRLRNLFKKVLTSIFNSSNYMKELYEETFTYIFPCYEILFVIQKSKG
ncbi:methyltransferase domain-containing protein [Algoriphagus aestuariicola]|jgi:ubiquinone/menaquinone biosynthesis C-methylase UbiE|uniref:Methyltransferase domain-containing protein n=2 Tax=Algoriphagus aestuariicola TaxID=1852016 RepID=A0ABS3BNH9_9BACT|nr:methyltransferase domain-containing protein [Algoriphagus aestuariicola]